MLKNVVSILCSNFTIKMVYNHNWHHLIVVIVICIVVVVIIIVIYVVGYIDHGIHNGQRKRHESPGRHLNLRKNIYLKNCTYSCKR